MDGAEVVYRGDPASRSFSVFWVANGRPVAGANVNVPDPGKTMQGVIRRGAAVDLAALGDESRPLEQL